jgi:nucleolar GTP-binding protein
VEFERIPTVPTADEILDRSFRKAAAKMREKRNRTRANEEFVRAVSHAIHDRLVRVMSSFPDFETLSPFYREIVEILFGIDRIRHALGAVGWAARWTRLHGSAFARQTRASGELPAGRKRAVARMSSVLNQVDPELRFLNEVRNTLRALPHIDDSFTVVVAGYPNVGKSSFIRFVSSAEPEIASYPFTTTGIIVGHRDLGRDRIQFIDTPGVLDRPDSVRNRIERQAFCAMTRAAGVILFILDASGTSGFPLEDQLALLEDLRSLVGVPIVVAVNKSDLVTLDSYRNMSTTTGEGVEEVLAAVLAERPLSEKGPKDIRGPLGTTR